MRFWISVCMIMNGIWQYCIRSPSNVLQTCRGPWQWNNFISMFIILILASSAHRVLPGTPDGQSTPARLWLYSGVSNPAHTVGWIISIYSVVRAS